MKISDLTKLNPIGLQTIDPDSSVHAAVRKLVEHNIGALPVVDGSGSLVGIITERDVLRLMAGDTCADALNGTVGAAMRAGRDGCSASVAGGTRDADDTRRRHGKESCALVCGRTQRHRGARSGAARAADARRDRVSAQGSVEAGDGSLEEERCVGESGTVMGGGEAHWAARSAGRVAARRRLVLLFEVRFRRAVA